MQRCGDENQGQVFKGSALAACGGGRPRELGQVGPLGESGRGVLYA